MICKQCKSQGLAENAGFLRLMRALGRPMFASFIFGNAAVSKYGPSGVESEMLVKTEESMA